MKDINFRGSGHTEAVYWAHEAVRHANAAVKYSRIAFVLMSISAVLWLSVLVYRLWGS